MWKPGRLAPQRFDRKAAAERLARTLPALILAAEHLVNSYDTGVHGRRRAGSGEDFWQFKQYSPDDPASLIDWRQSAKREHVFIRQKEQETAETVWIWPDMSETMDYASDETAQTKAERAALLGLALALLLSKGGEKFGLLGQETKAATGPASFNKFSERLVTAPLPSFTDLTITERLSGKATIVLISDFLTPIEDVRRIMQSFVDAGCRGYLLQIADPAEVDLPFRGRTRFEGMRSEGTLTLGRVEAVQGEYQTLYTAHREALSSLARSLSWDYSFHRTDDAASDALARLYAALSISRR